MKRYLFVKTFHYGKVKYLGKNNKDYFKIQNKVVRSYSLFSIKKGSKIDPQLFYVLNV